MITLSIIAAYDINHGVGFNNTLPWHIPEDLKHFKKMTTGKNMIMGRKTFESLPMVLPNRKHIVLSSSKDLKNSDHPDVYIVSSKEECLRLLETLDITENMVIGGSKIWELFLPDVSELYITKIKSVYNVDTYFPEWDETKYKKEVISKNSDYDLLRFYI